MIFYLLIYLNSYLYYYTNKIRDVNSWPAEYNGFLIFIFFFGAPCDIKQIIFNISLSISCQSLIIIFKMKNVLSTSSFASENNFIIINNNNDNNYVSKLTIIFSLDEKNVPELFFFCIVYFYFFFCHFHRHIFKILRLRRLQNYW